MPRLAGVVNVTRRFVVSTAVIASRDAVDLDAAVVGSAIVGEIEKAQSAAEAVSQVGRFARELIVARASFA